MNAVNAVKDMLYPRQVMATIFLYTVAVLKPKKAEREKPLGGKLKK